MDVFLAGAVLLVAYGLIASKRFDRTLIALLGGLLVVVHGVIDQEEALTPIDFNVVVLVTGILAILLIEFFQSIVWWEVQPAGGAVEAAVLSGRLLRRDAAPSAGSVAAL